MNRVCLWLHLSFCVLCASRSHSHQSSTQVKNIKHDGNLALNDVYDIARKMRPRSQARKFSGTVLEILGTCTAVGCSVEGQKPSVLTQQIKNGELQVPEA